MPTQPAAVQHEWRRWRVFAEGRCEAACSDRHDRRKGRRCQFAGAWDGAAGRVLCRRHSDLYAAATGTFSFVDERAAL